jgi:hypothetical protein
MNEEINNTETVVIPDNPVETEEFLKTFKQEPIIEQPENEQQEQPKKRGRKKKEEIPVIGSNSSIITGALFLLFIDFIIPNILCMVHNRVSKKKMKPDLIKLTDEQKKELEPIADEVAKQINLQGSPVTILAASLAAIYLGNFFMNKQALK